MLKGFFHPSKASVSKSLTRDILARFSPGDLSLLDREVSFLAIAS
uniref:Uncharacterized protein n=1 Tax=Arundo donax TaxID=35708 RepID=A0A0A9EZ41_ARUDO